jgi:hypothetical protein
MLKFYVALAGVVLVSACAPLNAVNGPIENMTPSVIVDQLTSCAAHNMIMGAIIRDIPTDIVIEQNLSKSSDTIIAAATVDHAQNPQADIYSYVNQSRNAVYAKYDEYAIALKALIGTSAYDESFQKHAQSAQLCHEKWGALIIEKRKAAKTNFGI